MTQFVDTANAILIIKLVFSFAVYRIRLKGLENRNNLVNGSRTQTPVVVNQVVFVTFSFLGMKMTIVLI